MEIRNQSHSDVRGFNYQPSYATHGLESWLYKFDLETIRHELQTGKTHFPGMNTIRLWLSFDAFVSDNDAFVRNFGRVVELAESLEVKFIVTLFNFWHSIPDFGGVTMNQLSMLTRSGHEKVWTDYLRRTVGEHADDPRILMWDLCNEPNNSAEFKAMVFDWLKWVYDRCKENGATAPICVGSIPNMDAVATVEPISDVLTVHPYFAQNGWVPEKKDLQQFLDELVDFTNRKGKGLVATETCWGSLDDQFRAETATFELGELSKRKIGFTPHLLYESRVADAHRPDWGPVSTPGYMAFVHRDGTLRDGHDLFNKF